MAVYEECLFDGGGGGGGGGLKETSVYCLFGLKVAVCFIFFYIFRSSSQN